MMYKSSPVLKSLTVLSCLAFYFNHISYLAVGRFDYAYNMKANIVTGKPTFFEFSAHWKCSSSHLFRSRYRHWISLDCLVLSCASHSSICKENVAIPSDGRCRITAGSQRFCTNFLDVRRSFSLAFGHCTINGHFL